MKTPTLLTKRGHKEQHMQPRANDRRSTHRFRAEFGTLVSDKSGINNEVGVILDLSLVGCQVRVPVLVYPALVMELYINAPNLDRPIFVEKAVVQWVKGDTFGLHFLVLEKAELIRLGRVLAGLDQERVSIATDG
jgi:PilZ domain